MEDYKTSLEESRSINTYLTYSSNSITFFYFCLEHIKTNNHKNPNFKHLDIKDLDIIIENKENTVQYFTPPVYNDEIVNEKYKNDGEIDIVANNMYVYGLKMDNANNFFNYEYIYINDNINVLNLYLKKLVLHKNLKIYPIPYLPKLNEIIDKVTIYLISKDYKDHDLIQKHLKRYDNNSTYEDIIIKIYDLNLLNRISTVANKLKQYNKKRPMIDNNINVIMHKVKMLLIDLFIYKNIDLILYAINNNLIKKNDINCISRFKFNNSNDNEIDINKDKNLFNYILEIYNKLIEDENKYFNKYLKYKFKYINIKN